MLVAVLLAAGAGSRLGTPKALLDLDGVPALRRCADVLLRAGVGQVRVVLGFGAEQVRADVDLSGLDVRLNPDPARGQTASLRAGLAGGLGAAHGWLLHTVDHPLVRTSDVQQLIAAFNRRTADQAIVVPSVAGRRGHPALFAPGLAAEFTALEDTEPAHGVVRRDPRRVLHVVMDNPWLVRDLDTAEDLQAAREELRVRRRGGPA